MKKLAFLIAMFFLSLTTQAQIFELNENIYFETADSLLQIDTFLAGNIWQIGTPSKTFFDSAYSIPNAIVTDTINSYPLNNLSAFTIKISDPAWNQGQPLNRTIVTFFHKFDTDSLQDGGYIEVSYDDGVTWTNVANDPEISNFYYDPNGFTNPVIANGNEAYTGRSHGVSNGWQYGGFGWCYFPPTPYRTYLRFVFSSDSIQSNKDGWMIDDIQLHSDICEGIQEIQNDNLISIFPNPASDYLAIHITRASSKQAIQIFNYTGMLLYNNSSFSGEEIDTREYNNGIYLLKYSDTKNFSLKRFVVNH